MHYRPIKHLQSAWIGLLLVICILIAIILIARSLKVKGKLYRFTENKFPKVTPLIDELFAANVSNKKYRRRYFIFNRCRVYRDVPHFYCHACVGVPASFTVAAIAYIVSVLLMITSPFLRGLGAVELSLVYILEIYGYSTVQALSITVLYRLFEFWLPMALGILAFAWRGKNLFIRIVPALAYFYTGLNKYYFCCNAAVTHSPKTDQGISYRWKLLMHRMYWYYLLAWHCLITSAFMFKGLKNAWRMALLLSVLSLIGNLAKAWDYEEATFAAIIIILLLLSRSQYRIRGAASSGYALVYYPLSCFFISINLWIL